MGVSLAKVEEAAVKDQVLKDIGELITGLLDQLAANVDETQEKASFTVKCELSTDKEGAHFFEISGKTSLNTPTIRRGAQIIQKQLCLFGL